MSLKELRLKSNAELKKALINNREQMRELRFKIASKQHKNHQALRKLRREIAQIQTILKEKELMNRAKSQETKPAK